jgi:hypothetical protein
MFRRGIDEDEVRLVISAGETIAEYADDTPALAGLSSVL